MSHYPNKSHHVGHFRVGTGPAAPLITLHKRPNWMHRTMARILLGWTWEDRKA